LSFNSLLFCWLPVPTLWQNWSDLKTRAARVDYSRPRSYPSADHSAEKSNAAAECALSAVYFYFSIRNKLIEILIF
jgi:hypothetical protein